MSRVGKEKIDISKIKSYKLENTLLSIEGPLGTNNVVFPDFLVLNVDNEKKIITIDLKNEKEENKHHFSMHGTVVRLTKNAVTGVTSGFKKLFIFKGLGYKFTINNDILTMNLGYSQPVVCRVPQGIKAVAQKDKLELSSISKEMLGHFKDKLIKCRPWNPYSGKGIIEEGDVPYTKAVVKTKK